MAWTYDPAISTPRDEVRLEVGDTDTTDQLFQDSEIAFALTKEPNPLRCAAYLCDVLAARFSRQADFNVNNKIAFRASERPQLYRAMARELRRRANSRGLAPFTGTKPLPPRESTGDPNYDWGRIGGDDTTFNSLNPGRMP